MIYRRTKKEIELLKESSRILVETFKHVDKIIGAGVRMVDLDREIENFIKKNAANPWFKNYRGYPAASSISIDEVVVHGIPGERIIQEGQIVSIDIGVEKDGYCSDAAKTYIIGKVNGVKKKLVEVTKQALYNGIKKAVVGNRLYDISYEIQRTVESEGFSVVRELVGHGIGRKPHEEPEIPNFGSPNRGPRLLPGMIFAIEPMVNAGDYKIKILEDGWTVVTADGKPSAHFEHTIAITENKAEILTMGV
ncbi:type I methionyl aminopeptidase [candidate division KSB1 bacterium]|nr:MAG: type I methionyl aminopeptidase [candidate division KSB1 bacterium]